MITAAQRQRIRELEVRALRLVSGRLMGEWASNVRGTGLEFRDLREYVIGDDVRRLDWKATARSGRPQLRQFSEERQQEIWFALDLSASMTPAKAALAREVLAVLAWAAVRQGDPFGIVGFTDRIEFTRRPARGEAQLWAAVEDLLATRPASARTSFDALNAFALGTLSRRATLVIVSDFEGGADATDASAAADVSEASDSPDPIAPELGALARRHEAIGLRISDPAERGEPAAGPILLAPCVDGESGERAWIDPVSSRARRRLAASALESDRAIEAALRRAGVWYCPLWVGSDFIPPLMRFFHRRTELRGA